MRSYSHLSGGPKASRFGVLRGCGRSMGHARVARPGRSPPISQGGAAENALPQAGYSPLSRRRSLSIGAGGREAILEREAALTVPFRGDRRAEGMERPKQISGWVEIPGTNRGLRAIAARQSRLHLFGRPTEWPAAWWRYLTRHTNCVARPRAKPRATPSKDRSVDPGSSEDH